MKPKPSIFVYTALLIIALLISAGGAAIAQASTPLAPEELSPLQSGAPMIVSYQGVVKISGAPFTGMGYFKFAIVNQAGSTFYWSNAPLSGGQPNAAVTLNVSNGLFNVLLGDTTLINMAPLGAPVFDGSERYFRVWFSRDNVTFSQLAPDRRIASVPYALQAEEARNLVLADTNPVARGYIDTYLDGPIQVFVAGRYAYVTSTFNDRLVIFDVSDPDAIVALGYISGILDGPWGVYVAGRYAYVTSGWNNILAIFDVSNPVSIVSKGYISTNLAGPATVYVAGRYAYVISQTNDRLAIFDVSDPDNIVAKGYISTNLDDPDQVFIVGNYAYVTSPTNNRLAIFDVSDPDAIVARGYISTNLSWPFGLYVSGSFAYVGNRGNNRLAIFDISDPDNIVARGYTSTNLVSPDRVYVAGHYAYVSGNGLAVFDVSDPDNIVAKGYISLPTGVNWVTVSGRYAYVLSQGNNRLGILDLNHLEAPTLDTGALWTGSLQVGDNAIMNNGLSVQGSLTVGPGGAQVGGDLGVEGKLRVAGDYIQFPTISGSAPPAADCDESSEYGRVVVRTDGTTNLYVCTASGWVGK
jgi:hypothetical protein